MACMGDSCVVGSSLRKTCTEAEAAIGIVDSASETGFEGLCASLPVSSITNRTQITIVAFEVVEMVVVVGSLEATQLSIVSLQRFNVEGIKDSESNGL